MTGVAVRGYIVSGFVGAGGAVSPLAALSTAGTSPTPQPSGPLANPGQPAVPAAGQSHKRRRWWPRGIVPNALIALAAFGLLTGSCLDTCTRMNTVRHVPAIHGRVVDMETGQPISGVKVTRWFERDMFAGPGGSDTYRVKGSLRTVTSDAAGRFELPAWYGIARGINAVQWTEYKPGWVAGWGNLYLGMPRSLQVSRRTFANEFVHAEMRRDGLNLAVTLSLHRVGASAAAEEHFWAMRILLQNGMIQEEDFVKEALSYSSTHEVSLELFKTFDSVFVDLGGHRDDRPCYKANLAWTMLGLEERLCTQHSEWRFCTAGGLQRSRDFLQRTCPTFRR